MFQELGLISSLQHRFSLGVNELFPSHLSLETVLGMFRHGIDKVGNC